MTERKTESMDVQKMRDVNLRSERSPSDKKLPILEFEAEIKEKLQTSETALLVGETGSGKTTQMPLFLMETLPDSKIAITQPRRVAVRSVSKYVAEKASSKIGEEIGYRIRHDDRTTEGTRVTFMTDGIALRDFHDDPLLLNFDVVVVDEAHERSLNIDVVLGLAKRAQEQRKKQGLKPLKIVVMSATLEKDKFQGFFTNSPLIEVPGRLHPVEVEHSPTEVKDYVSAAAEKVHELHQGRKIDGDILIFMPGKQEINGVIEKIKEFSLGNVDCFPLHGEMEAEDQDKIFKPTPGRIKVIVSTNVAETSVTVPSVKIVIDSGLIRQTEYNDNTGIEALKLVTHAKSGFIQRTGRAGRVAPGKCYRLFTEEVFNEARDYQMPEIQRTNLSHVVLLMKKMGIEDVEHFPFVDSPKELAIKEAIAELQLLGALDEKEEVTEIGEFMAELPLDPKIARMIYESSKMDEKADQYDKEAEKIQNEGKEREALALKEKAKKLRCTEGLCTIAAFFSARDVFFRPQSKEEQEKASAEHAKFKVSGSDFLTLLAVWRSYEKENFNFNDPKDKTRFHKWCKENYLRSYVIEEVAKVRQQLFRALGKNGIRAIEGDDPESVGKAITVGLIGNFSSIVTGNDAVRLKDGQQGKLPFESAFTSFGADKHFVFYKLREINFKDKLTGGPRKLNLFTNIQAIKPEWIFEVAPQICEVVHDGSKEEWEMYFDANKGAVVAPMRIRIKEVGTEFEVLKQVRDEKAKSLFIRYLVDGRIYPLPFFHARNLEIVKNVRVLPGIKKVPDLYSWYEQQMGLISSLEEAEQIADSLVLNISDYIDPAKLAEYEKKHPTRIIIGDKELSVEYENGWRAERIIIRFDLDALVAIEDSQVPPLGEENSQKIYEIKIGWLTLSADSISELRKKFLENADRMSFYIESPGLIARLRNVVEEEKRKLDERRSEEKKIKRERLKAEEAKKKAEKEKPLQEKLESFKNEYLLLEKIITTMPVSTRSEKREKVSDIVEKIKGRKKELIQLLESLASKINSDDPEIKSIEGVIATIRTKLISYIKHKDFSLITGEGFIGLDKLTADWESISGKVESSELVQGLIDPSRYPEVVSAVKKLYIEESVVFWKNGTVNVDALVEKALEQLM